MIRIERKIQTRAEHLPLFLYEPGQQLPQREIRDTLDTRGFAIIRGIPVVPFTTDDERRDVSHEWRKKLKFLGTPLKQDRKGTLEWFVRDEGVRHESNSGKGQVLRGGKASKSSDELYMHNDAAPRWHEHDIQTVALLVFAQAREGGGTTLVDARKAYRVLQSENPTAASTLTDSTFYFDRTSGYDEGQLPFSSGHIIELEPFRVRHSPRIRQGFEIAEKVLLPEQDDAMTAWDGVLSRPDLHTTFTLQAGELLLLNEDDILHARTSFTNDPQNPRTLTRMWFTRPANPA